MGGFSFLGWTRSPWVWRQDHLARFQILISLGASIPNLILFNTKFPQEL
jgi:hypothetical protein